MDVWLSFYIYLSYKLEKPVICPYIVGTMAKTDTIEFRVTPEEKMLIQEAADISYMKRTHFILDTVLPRAKKLIDQQHKLKLSSVDTKLLMKKLDASPRNIPKLKKLFSKQSVFDA